MSGFPQRFTAYRRNISERDTYNALQKNADNEPQFEGVIWTDGTVTLRWLTASRSTSVWACLSDMLAIHGRPEYGTEIVWHDAPAPDEWSDILSAFEEQNSPKREALEENAALRAREAALSEAVAAARQEALDDAWRAVDACGGTGAHVEYATALDHACDAIEKMGGCDPALRALGDQPND